MTTSVKVTACCSSNKELVIELDVGDVNTKEIIQDRETREYFVYDARSVTIYEQEKV